MLKKQKKKKGGDRSKNRGVMIPKRKLNGCLEREKNVKKGKEIEEGIKELVMVGWLVCWS